MVNLLVIPFSSYHSEMNVYESFIDEKIASQFHILATLSLERNVHNGLIGWLTKAQETILIQLKHLSFYGIITTSLQKSQSPILYPFLLSVAYQFLSLALSLFTSLSLSLYLSYLLLDSLCTYGFLQHIIVYVPVMMTERPC